MRSPCLRFAIVSFIISLSTSGAWAATPAQEMLEKAFETYCGTLDPKPTPCTAGVSLDRKYLFLEPLCPIDPNAPAQCAPPQGHCAEFECALRLDGQEHLVPLVIALDHETGRWEGRDGLANAGKGRLEFDVAGQPTVSLTDDERIVVVVKNTNPMLYSAIPGKPTEVDVPDLAEFQKLLTAFGGGLSALARTVAAAPTRFLAPEVGVPDDYETSVNDTLALFQSALLDVQCRTGQTEIQTARATHFVQSLELGRPGEYVYKPLVPESCTKGCSECSPNCAPRCERIDSLTSSAVHKAFSKLQVATFAPQDRPEDCVAVLDAALAVIDADMKDPAKVRTAYRTFELAPKGACLQGDTLRDALKSVLAEINQTSINARRLQAAVESHANDLKRLEGLSKPSAADKEALADLRAEKTRASEALERMREELVRQQQSGSEIIQLSRLGKQLAEVRKQGENIFAKRTGVEKAASQTEAFERRIERFRIASRENCDDGACVKTAALDPRIILEPQLKKARATKIQNHTLKVKTDSAYHEKVVATRPAELDAAYSLDSVLRGLWGISASMIYTELANPTFGAVTSEDDPMKMVIAQTDEETRAGGIALLADFRLARWLACRGSYSPGCSDRWDWLGIELGAGVGGDPAFFGGLSFRLPRSRSWRLGVGWTYQQVKELAGGQTIGDPVASADDVKRRDDFNGDWYVSLSFALDSLRLFSSGD